MLFSEKLYTFLKWALLIGVNAVNAFVVAIGKLYSIDDAIIVIVTGTISAVALLLGVCTGISNKNYNAKNLAESIQNAIEDAEGSDSEG